MAVADVFTCTEAARCYPEGSDSPSHDAFTRLLQRWPPDTEALWIESSHFVRPGEGILIVDDTTLDKPHAKKMENPLRVKVNEGQRRWKPRSYAMAARLADHIWTIEELMRTVVVPNCINPK